jgi:hypothetical protein
MASKKTHSGTVESALITMLYIFNTTYIYVVIGVLFLILALWGLMFQEGMVHSLYNNPLIHVTPDPHPSPIPTHILRASSTETTDRPKRPREWRP